MCCFLNYRNEEGVSVMIPITSGRSHRHWHHVKRAMEVMKICTRILNVAMFQMKSVMSAFRYFFPRFPNAVSEQMNNPVLFCFWNSLLLSWSFNVWSWRQTNRICSSLVDQVDGHTKKKSWYEAILLRLLSQRSSSFQEKIFVSSLHIEKKRLFNLKCHLRNNGCPRCPRKNKILATQQNSALFSATCCQLHRKLLSKRRPDIAR